MSATQVCPVVGTTNTVLPPAHPEFDMEKPGQVCPVTNATTDHHTTLQMHPSITSAANPNDAAACPALKGEIEKPQNQALDEAVCPVVGPVSTVLPPDHPDMSQNKEGDECPITKAKLGHHKGKVVGHPSVEGAEKGAVCPVVGRAVPQ